MDYPTRATAAAAAAAAPTCLQGEQRQQQQRRRRRQEQGGVVSHHAHHQSSTVNTTLQQGQALLTKLLSGEIQKRHARRRFGNADDEEEEEEETGFFFSHEDYEEDGSGFGQSLLWCKEGNSHVRVVWLNQDNIQTLTPGTVVRLRGMVQDMGEAEYYYHHDHHRHRRRRYHDYPHDNDQSEEEEGDGDDDENGMPPASTRPTERTPIIITPIPCTTAWYRAATHARNNWRTTTNNNEEESCFFDNEQVVGESSWMHHPSKKLRLGDDDDDNGDSNNNPMMTHNNETTHHQNNSHHWPPGTMGSDPEQVPVLAKFYYDLYPQYNDDDENSNDDDNNHRNRNNYHHGSSPPAPRVPPTVSLNQVVEIVGVLDYPLPTPAQQHQQGEEESERHHFNVWDTDIPYSNTTACGFSTGPAVGDTGMDWQGFPENDNNNNRHPTLSRSYNNNNGNSDMRCIHVLSFRTGLPLEDLVDGTNDDSSSPQQIYSSAEVCWAHLLGLPTSTETAPNNSNTTTNNNNEFDTMDVSPHSTALYLTLLSQAERQPVVNSHYILTGTPMVTTAPPASCSSSSISKCINTTITLGCASLNMIVNHANTGRALYHRLNHVLKQVVPVLQTLEVTMESFCRDNDNNNNSGPLSTRPSKTTTTTASSSSPAISYLRPHVLQLPPGATLLLLNVDDRLATAAASSSTMTTTSLTATTAVEMLQELARVTSCHQLEYQFDGHVRVPFEADWRIIVISIPTTQSLLPCTVQTTISTAWTMALMNNNNTSPDWTMTGCDAAAVAHVRAALVHSRRPKSPFQRYNNNNNVGGGGGGDITIRRRRRRGRNNNTRLSPELMDWAPKFFCQQRESERRLQQQQHTNRTLRPITTTTTTTTTEETFHQWLTLTRLWARHRGGGESLSLWSSSYGDDNNCYNENDDNYNERGGRMAQIQDLERAVALQQALVVPASAVST